MDGELCNLKGKIMLWFKYIICDEIIINKENIFKHRLRYTPNYVYFSIIPTAFACFRKVIIGGGPKI